MKKRIAIILASVMTLAAGIFALAACNDSEKVIGIIQFGNHESLNNCYNGIVAGLNEEGVNKANGYIIELQVSNFDASVSAAQAQNFANKNVEMIGAIATPSALAAASAAKGAIPVVYCAVSDPASTQLTEMSNVTGSSDIMDFEGQIELIKAFLPDVDKIGVIYCTGEDNSISQLNTMTEIASAQGIQIVPKSINNATEIKTALDVLLATEGLDCISNLTDNTVVGVLDTILEEADKKNLPVFGSEIEQVKKGCIAAVSLDYAELGRLTGVMMAKIIKGEKTAVKGEFIKITESEKFFNSAAALALGISVPTSIDMSDVIAA